MSGAARDLHPTRALLHLDRMTRNFRLLAELAGGRPLWPAIKANAYGHGAAVVAHHLVSLGCERLCVAHASEAVELIEAGVRARIVLLSALLADGVEPCVEHDLEPVVCDADMVDALARAASRAGRRVGVHVAVDTGMGRIGVRPEDVKPFLDRCRAHPELDVVGLMSHFPRADEADKSYSRRQIELFARAQEAAADPPIPFHHLANSAAIFDLPESHLDAVRPGVSLYGLAPSGEIANPRVAELAPVLEWRTRITFLKEVPEGTGLSYGHTFRTSRPSLVATLPVGYGDGLHRGLSNRLEVLVRGVRCPQVGTITMDQCLVDVTALRGRVAVGDDAVLIGRDGDEEVTAAEIATRLGTIAYEVVTSLAPRVPRLVAPPAVDSPVR